jgi:hypothetical protein
VRLARVRRVGAALLFHIGSSRIPEPSQFKHTGSPYRCQWSDLPHKGVWLPPAPANRIRGSV